MRKLTAMLILLALLSGCGAGPVENTQTAPPAATPEVRVIEAGSGIFGREEMPMPEGYTSCSPYAEGRDRAFFKLTGSGSLRDTRFRRESGVIVSPFAGVEYRLYPGIPGCAAAAAAYAPADFPPGPERVDTRELQRA